MSHTTTSSLTGYRVVPEFDYIRVVAERDELVKALRKACVDVIDEFGYYPNPESVTATLAKYPEKT